MNAIGKFLEKISKFLNDISRILIFSSMVLVVVNIILRALFKNPITGVYDILMLISIVTISLALAYCHVTDGHVQVTFIVEKFPRALRMLIVLILDLAGIVMFGAIDWYILFHYVNTVKLSGKTTLTTGIPIYPFYYILAFGILLLLLVSVHKFIVRFGKED